MPVHHSPTVDHILAHAQEIVDQWRHDPDRGPFRHALDAAEQQRWRGFSDRPAERVAFRKVAQAIRLGYGHAVDNPDPLIAIVLDVLESRDPPSSPGHTTL